MKFVYSYNSMSEEIETRRVLRSTKTSITIESGISGQVIRRSELDCSGPYFTTPVKAVDAFIVRSEQRMSCRNQYGTLALGAFRDAIGTARRIRARLT